ncbi:hypothetical protein SNEBB_002535 [Seison nebaliae]|nr:hypothetical protein SNEBB_002535 [Seison nebaliae]
MKFASFLRQFVPNTTTNIAHISNTDTTNATVKDVSITDVFNSIIIPLSESNAFNDPSNKYKSSLQSEQRPSPSSIVNAATSTTISHDCLSDAEQSAVSPIQFDNNLLKNQYSISSYSSVFSKPFDDSSFDTTFKSSSNSDKTSKSTGASSFSQIGKCRSHLFLSASEGENHRFHLTSSKKKKLAYAKSFGRRILTDKTSKCRQMAKNALSTLSLSKPTTKSESKSPILSPTSNCDTLDYSTLFKSSTPFASLDNSLTKLDMNESIYATISDATNEIRSKDQPNIKNRNNSERNGQKNQIDIIERNILKTNFQSTTSQRISDKSTSGLGSVTSSSDDDKNNISTSIDDDSVDEVFKDCLSDTSTIFQIYNKQQQQQQQNQNKNKKNDIYAHSVHQDLNAIDFTFSATTTIADNINIENLTKNIKPKNFLEKTPQTHKSTMLIPSVKNGENKETVSSKKSKKKKPEIISRNRSKGKDTGNKSTVKMNVEEDKKLKNQRMTNRINKCDWVKSMIETMESHNVNSPSELTDKSSQRPCIKHVTKNCLKTFSGDISDELSSSEIERSSHRLNNEQVANSNDNMVNWKTINITNKFNTKLNKNEENSKVKRKDSDISIYKKRNSVSSDHSTSSLKNSMERRSSERRLSSISLTQGGVIAEKIKQLQKKNRTAFSNDSSLLHKRTTCRHMGVEVKSDKTKNQGTNIDSKKSTRNQVRNKTEINNDKLKKEVVKKMNEVENGLERKDAEISPVTNEKKKKSINKEKLTKELMIVENNRMMKEPEKINVTNLSEPPEKDMESYRQEKLSQKLSISQQVLVQMEECEQRKLTNENKFSRLFKSSIPSTTTMTNGKNHHKNNTSESNTINSLKKNNCRVTERLELTERKLTISSTASIPLNSEIKRSLSVSGKEKEGRWNKDVDCSDEMLYDTDDNEAEEFIFDCSQPFANIMNDRKLKVLSKYHLNY